MSCVQSGSLTVPNRGDQRMCTTMMMSGVEFDVIAPLTNAEEPYKIALERPTQMLSSEQQECILIWTDLHAGASPPSL